MQSSLRNYLAAGFLLGIMMAACNLPVTASRPDDAGTLVAATIFALQTDSGGTQTQLVVQVPTSEATPNPTTTAVPSITPTPLNPTVTKLSLCLAGPGKAYKVVSSIKSGTEVQLLGVGSVAGWYIIENPVYHGRCWIEAASIRTDPGLNVAALTVFNPPPTPGPKATLTPTP